MSSKAEMKKEIQQLLEEGHALLQLTGNDDKFLEFSAKYQNWYTKVLRVISTLTPERLSEFKGYYEIDQKRKHYTSSTYAIQDYIKGLGASKDRFGNAEWDHHNILGLRILSQINILSSVTSRIDSVLADIEGNLIADYQDAELATASQLKKTSLRAAGTLAGVVLEGHLQRIAKTYGVKVRKAHPTIADLNDPLKQANIYDTPTWRRIQLF